MGITLKINLSLIFYAFGLSDVRKSIIPFITKEETVSPGCTLADSMIPLSVINITLFIDIFLLLRGNS